MTQPLDGIRVLEIGHFIAGPFAGMLLGDMGADVIKIEHPGRGDQARATPPIINGESASFAVLNRNKRSIALDLKQKAARELVLEMAAKSDVFLENNRPGSMKSLGLGPEDIRAVNPKIVYVSASGFGQTGPYSRKAGVNLIIEAFAGTLSVTGSPDDMPMRPGIQTADIFGALFATYAVLCGLVSVLRDKGGRIADVSLVEASIAAAAWETAGYLATGEVPTRIGHQHRLNCPYQLFETADGVFLAIGAPNDNLFAELMKVLGLEIHLQSELFSTYSLRKANEKRLLEIIMPAILLKNSVELEKMLAAVGVPCSRVNNYEELFADPHVEARKVLVEVNHPRIGNTRLVRNPVVFDEHSPVIRRPAPLLGQHSKEILQQFGYEESVVQKLSEDGIVFLGSAVA